jgi:hypothetical protein
MSDSLENSAQKQLVSFLAIVGSILLFVLVIYLAYLPNRPAPVDAQLIESRQQQLAEVEAAGKSALRDYRIVNRNEGVVVVPIERAMLLTVQELLDPAGAVASETPNAE